MGTAFGNLVSPVTPKNHVCGAVGSGLQELIVGYMLKERLGSGHVSMHCQLGKPKENGKNE